jgi:hypothetical protein
MYISCVCVSAVGSAVPVQFYVGTSVVWAAGLTDFPFFLALQWRVRYGRIGEGGGPFSLCFLQFAVSSLGGWVSAVGILCYIFSVGSFVVFFAVSYFTRC